MWNLKIRNWASVKGIMLEFFQFFFYKLAVQLRLPGQHLQSDLTVSPKT